MIKMRKPLSFKSLLQSAIAVMLSPRKITLPGTIGSLANWASLGGVCSGIVGTVSKRFWLAALCAGGGKVARNFVGIA